MSESGKIKEKSVKIFSLTCCITVLTLLTSIFFTVSVCLLRNKAFVQEKTFFHQHVAKLGGKTTLSLIFPSSVSEKALDSFWVF